MRSTASFIDQIQARSEEDRLRFAAQLLSRSFSPSQRSPSTASEAIQVWDFIAANARDPEHIRELLAEHCDPDLYSLELHGITQLSQNNGTSRRKRKDVLRIFFAWKVWPWRILPDLCDQDWGKNLLGELVAFAQTVGEFEDARPLLQEAYNGRLQSSTRGVSRKPELTIRDVRGAKQSYRNELVPAQNSVTLRKRKPLRYGKVPASKPASSNNTDPSLNQTPAPIIPPIFEEQRPHEAGRKSPGTDKQAQIVDEEDSEREFEIGRGYSREGSGARNESTELEPHLWALEEEGFNNYDVSSNDFSKDDFFQLQTPQTTRSSSPVHADAGSQVKIVSELALLRPAAATHRCESSLTLQPQKRNMVVDRDSEGSLASSTLRYRLEIVSEVSSFSARFRDIQARMNQDASWRAAHAHKQTERDGLLQKLEHTGLKVETAGTRLKEIQERRVIRARDLEEREQNMETLNQQSETMRETREGLQQQIVDDHAALDGYDEQLQTLRTKLANHRASEKLEMEEVERNLEQQLPYHEALNADADDLAAAATRFLSMHERGKKRTRSERDHD